MALELVPDPGLGDPAPAAVAAALARLGLVAEGPSRPPGDPWYRTGLQEAVERSMDDPDAAPARHGAFRSAALDYAPLPRRTRGATRA